MFLMRLDLNLWFGYITYYLYVSVSSVKVGSKPKLQLGALLVSAISLVGTRCRKGGGPCVEILIFAVITGTRSPCTGIGLAMFCLLCLLRSVNQHSVTGDDRAGPVQIVLSSYPPKKGDWRQRMSALSPKTMTSNCSPMKQIL